VKEKDFTDVTLFNRRRTHVFMLTIAYGIPVGVLKAGRSFLAISSAFVLNICNPNPICK
jgi:hypothetical protein